MPGPGDETSAGGAAGLFRHPRLGLVRRSGRRYAYALAEKGTRTALLFVLFHQRLFGPLAYNQLVKRPDSEQCHKATWNEPIAVLTLLSTRLLNSCSRTSPRDTLNTFLIGGIKSISWSVDPIDSLSCNDGRLLA